MYKLHNVIYIALLHIHIGTKELEFSLFFYFTLICSYILEEHQLQQHPDFLLLLAAQPWMHLVFSGHISVWQLQNPLLL